MTDSITIRAPDDLHVHLRDGPMLEQVLPYSARHFGRILAMPNLDPPITTGEQSIAYSMRIKMRLLGAHPLPYTDVLPTIKILPETTPEIIANAKLRGVAAGKLYPANVTTNSSDGVRDFHALYPVFAEMQRVGMVLCLHGEHPDTSVHEQNRETAFLPTLIDIVRSFPSLRIVFEHVSTAAAVECILGLPSTVAATVTAHHLLCTRYDIVTPHQLCMPILKEERDRAALQRVVLQGHPKFFFGSDSAPHSKEAKERQGSRVFGIFSAPVALPLLAEFFTKHGCFERLEPFVSVYGAHFYDMPLNRGRVQLTRTPWVVTQEHDDLVPFWLGRTISWSANRIR